MINTHWERGLTLLLSILMDYALLTLVFALTMCLPYRAEMLCLMHIPRSHHLRLSLSLHRSQYSSRWQMEETTRLD